MIVGYVVAQLAGFWLVTLIAAATHGLGLHMNLPLSGWAVSAGVLLGAVWVVTFTWYFARPWLHDANAGGLAWCAPSQHHSYAVALLMAFTLVALVVVTELLLPPDPRQLTGPMQLLSTSRGATHVLFVLLAVVIAPPVEELMFRGVAFAAVARRSGTAAATLLTTLAFVVLHAADKIHYWPGFMLVGGLALANVFLRLRYRSLWPGILLHMTYNGLLILLT